MPEIVHLPKCLPMVKPSNIEGEFTCIYCGRKFKKQNALRIHLGTCKKRALRRDFKIGHRTFYVYMNPRKDIYNPLKEHAKSCQEKPILFIGALDYLKQSGWITKYLVLDNEKFDVED